MLLISLLFTTFLIPKGETVLCGVVCRSRGVFVVQLASVLCVLCS